MALKKRLKQKATHKIKKSTKKKKPSKKRSSGSQKQKGVRSLLGTPVIIKNTDMENAVRDIAVTKARYVRDLVLEVTFSDNHVSLVDFSEFLNMTQVTYLKSYLKTNEFRKFKIEEGNVVWGDDWDLIFPVDQLYRGKIIIE